MTGSLLDLPGGPLGLAVGVEHRDLKGRFDPDATVAAGLGSDIPALPTKGGYNIDEAYAELNAPLLADRPFFQLLELNGAVRFSDYSGIGSTTTFKAGVNWKPVDDLRLRGPGPRAPCPRWGIVRKAVALRQEFSPSQRIRTQPARSCQLRRAGRFLPAIRNNIQISVITGGSENLKPETSKGWNLGAVYSPGFLPRFSIEANYYNIKVKGAIQAINANTTLQNCVINNDPTACALVTRTASGQIANIQGLLDNIAAIKTEGLDVNLTYRTPKMDWGTIGFTLNNTFLFNYDVFVPTATGTQRISREGTEQGSPDQAFPKHKAIGIIDWNGTHFGASLTGRYIKSVKESEADNTLNSRFYTDVQLRWFSPDFADNFSFAVGANNLLDKDPPGCFSCGLNNFDPGTYDVPGRYLYARATVKY